MPARRRGRRSTRANVNYNENDTEYLPENVRRSIRSSTRANHREQTNSQSITVSHPETHPTSENEENIRNAVNNSNSTAASRTPATGTATTAATSASNNTSHPSLNSANNSNFPSSSTTDPEIPTRALTRARNSRFEVDFRDRFININDTSEIARIGDFLSHTLRNAVSQNQNILRRPNGQNPNQATNVSVNFPQNHIANLVKNVLEEYRSDSTAEARNQLHDDFDRQTGEIYHWYQNEISRLTNEQMYDKALEIIHQIYNLQEELGLNAEENRPRTRSRNRRSLLDNATSAETPASTQPPRRTSTRLSTRTQEQENLIKTLKLKFMTILNSNIETLIKFSTMGALVSINSELINNRARDENMTAYIEEVDISNNMGASATRRDTAARTNPISNRLANVPIVNPTQTLGQRAVANSGNFNNLETGSRTSYGYDDEPFTIFSNPHTNRGSKKSKTQNLTHDDIESIYLEKLKKYEKKLTALPKSNERYCHGHKPMIDFEFIQNHFNEIYPIFQAWRDYEIFNGIFDTENKQDGSSNSGGNSGAAGTNSNENESSNSPNSAGENPILNRLFNQGEALTFQEALFPGSIIKNFIGAKKLGKVEVDHTGKKLNCNLQATSTSENIKKCVDNMSKLIKSNLDEIKKGKEVKKGFQWS